jgi:membrane-bound metal-dependent hydrolase YbcI (DUF457 family)
VEKVSLGVYYLTKTSGDPDRCNGHRTLTQTLPFVGMVGCGTTALCVHFGRWAVLGVLFFTFGLALRGLFGRWAARSGWLAVTAASAAAAGLAFTHLPAGRGYPLLGAAAGVGALVHVLGDWITHAGVPLAWPIPVGGRMWRMFGLVDPLAVTCGGLVEALALRGVFVAIAAMAAVALFFPSLLTPFGIHP